MFNLKNYDSGVPQMKKFCFKKKFLKLEIWDVTSLTMTSKSNLR